MSLKHGAKIIALRSMLDRIGIDLVEDGVEIVAIDSRDSNWELTASFLKPRQLKGMFDKLVEIHAFRTNGRRPSCEFDRIEAVLNELPGVKT